MIQEKSKRPHLGLTLSLTSRTFSRARLWNNLALAGCTLGCGRVDKLDRDILAPEAAGKGETILDLTKDKFSESKARPSNNLVLAVLWRLEKYVRTM